MQVHIQEPLCEHGYTNAQLQDILGDRGAEFARWMRGQTVCRCPEHGTVTYPWDLRRFLEGGIIVD